MTEQLQIRVHDPDCKRDAHGNVDLSLATRKPIPTLIYLPGLHGDWTLVGSFRKAVACSTRFVEITYPRSTSWSLDDYAAEIECALERSAIDSGWLLAESYGSQVAWQIVQRKRLQIQGLILAGGFVQHPTPRGVRLVSWFVSRLSMSSIGPLLGAYARIARFRFRNAPEVFASIQEFLSRRTDPDLCAVMHRLNLIAQNDPSPAARQCQLPVYSITALFDPIVPWPPVQRWLIRNCPGLKDRKIIWSADHAVLASAPLRAAEQILKWIGQPVNSST